MSADASFDQYKQHRPRAMSDEWLRIVSATDPESPVCDEAVADLEADHAQWAAMAHDVVSGFEAMLREVSEG